jgi:hypothetical protein
VRALLILETNGFEEEAAPLRRTLIEHVLGLKWIAVEGNAVVDTVARGHARDAAKRLDALSTANWASINLADLQETIDEIGAEGRSSSSDHLLHFLQRLQRYGDIHTLPGYLAETALTHPTYQSAVKYFDVSSGEPQPLMEPAGARIPQVAFATTQLLEALLALRQIFAPPPWEEQLTDIMRRYDEITNMVRIQDGLRPVDWATGKLA